MPKFDVELRIIVEAENADAAFVDVGTNYWVINDPAKRTDKNTAFVDMFVAGVTKVDDDTSILDYAT